MDAANPQTWAVEPQEKKNYSISYINVPTKMFISELTEIINLYVKGDYRRADATEEHLPTALRVHVHIGQVSCIRNQLLSAWCWGVLKLVFHVSLGKPNVQAIYSLGLHYSATKKR
jgi:hypothetical protein